MISLIAVTAMLNDKGTTGPAAGFFYGRQKDVGECDP
jgi:hypothetical protein